MEEKEETRLVYRTADDDTRVGGACYVPTRGGLYR
jgi:hypothetical protein